MFKNAIDFNIKQCKNLEIDVFYQNKTHINNYVTFKNTKFYLYKTTESDQCLKCTYKIEYDISKIFMGFYNGKSLIYYDSTNVKEKPIDKIINIKHIYEKSNYIFNYHIKDQNNLCQITYNFEQFDFNKQYYQTILLLAQKYNFQVLQMDPLILQFNLKTPMRQIQFIDEKYDPKLNSKNVNIHYDFKGEIMEHLINSDYFIFQIPLTISYDNFNYFRFNNGKYLIFKQIHNKQYTYLYCYNQILNVEFTHNHVEESEIKQAVVNQLPNMLHIYLDVNEAREVIYYKIT